MNIIDAGLIFRGPVPNGGEQAAIDAVVLHHRAGDGTVESLHEMHLDKKWWGIGYHYYIRRDGTIYRGREERFVGSHAGSSNDYNKHSIGVCFEGEMDTVDTLTPEQIASGRWLLSDIKSRHPIKEIRLHKELAATACPGRNFGAQKLIAHYVVQIETESKESAEALAKLLQGAKIMEV